MHLLLPFSTLWEISETFHMILSQKNGSPGTIMVRPYLKTYFESIREKYRIIYDLENSPEFQFHVEEAWRFKSIRNSQTLVQYLAQSRRSAYLSNEWMLFCLTVPAALGGRMYPLKHIRNALKASFEAGVDNAPKILESSMVYWDGLWDTLLRFLELLPDLTSVSLTKHPRATLWLWSWAWSPFLFENLLMGVTGNKQQFYFRTQWI